MKTNYSNQQNLENQTQNYGIKQTNSTLRSVLIGLVFVGVALLIIGHRLGLISNYAYHLLISWQMLLITIGVINILTWRGAFWGSILVVVGAVFLLPKIFIVPIALSKLSFPIILLLVGVLIILKSLFKKNNINFHKKFDDELIDYSEDYIREKYVFGGTNMQVKSQNFKGGKIEAVFGGGRIDFSMAQLSIQDKVILDLELVFGGLEIIVPQDWTVIIKSQSVFGGIVEKKSPLVQTDPTKEFIIIGKAVFGGAEIKRF